MDAIENVHVACIIGKLNECMSFFSIANTLLTILGKEACLWTTYRSLCKDSAKLRVSFGNWILYMGILIQKDQSNG